MSSNIPLVSLGNEGPKVQQLGFGTMGLSVFYGTPASDEERLKFLDEVYASGQRFWDTADMYGDSEDLLGKWFKRSGKRNDIFLATKFANRWQDGKLVADNDPEYIKQACEKSLQRLGIDTIDLYYCHRMDRAQPIEITVRAMASLKKQGKVRCLGLSECSSETLRRACAVEHIDAVQIEYSPFSMDIEDPSIGLLKTCREMGVSVVAYSPLGRGFITGRYQSPEDFPEGDFRKIAPRFNAENFHKNLELADSILTLAKKKDCTPAQLTLAWLMSQGPDIIPIPGSSKVRTFKENMGALNVKLTKDEEAQIRQVVEAVEVSGERYPPGMTANLFADTAPLTS